MPFKCQYMVLGATTHEPRNLGRFCEFPKFTSFFRLSYLIHMLVVMNCCQPFVLQHCSLPAFSIINLNLHILLVPWHEQGVDLGSYFQYFPKQILNLDSNRNQFSLARKPNLFIALWFLSPSFLSFSWSDQLCFFKYIVSPTFCILFVTYRGNSLSPSLTLHYALPKCCLHATETPRIFITFRSQQKTIINSMAVNEDGVLATGGMSYVLYKLSCLL